MTRCTGPAWPAKRWATTSRRTRASSSARVCRHRPCRPSSTPERPNRPAEDAKAPSALGEGGRRLLAGQRGSVAAEVATHRRKAALGTAVVPAPFAGAEVLAFERLVGLPGGVHQAVGLVESVPDPVIAQIGD